MSIPFESYGKTPRLFRDMVITEKIDGTNAGIGIERVGIGTSLAYDNLTEVVLDETTAGIFPTHEYIVWAQSKNRVITPGKSNDNAGFAGWVADNAHALVDALGVGLHFGEWYGEGIQGNPLGIAGRRFALFNVGRWGSVNFAEFGLDDVETVPHLYQGEFDTLTAWSWANALKSCGSEVRGAHHAAKPEGIIVYHGQARQVFKVLCDRDEIPKTVRDAA